MENGTNKERQGALLVKHLRSTAKWMTTSTTRLDSISGMSRAESVLRSAALRWKALVLAGVLVATALVGLAFASPALAVANSYVYTQPGHQSALATCWNAPACGVEGRPIYPANGTVAQMLCWTDQGWFTGNYASNRWFIVTINGQPGQWWIHSSYVYYQASVGHC